jgi:hypothetical protein
MLEQINGKQILIGTISALAFLSAASGQMEGLFGHSAAIMISSGAAFLVGLVSAVMAPYLGNTSVVRDAQDVNGVRLLVSHNASPAIAAMAVDPAYGSIEAEKGQEAAVAKIAEGANL